MPQHVRPPRVIAQAARKRNAPHAAAHAQPDHPHDFERAGNDLHGLRLAKRPPRQDAPCPATPSARATTRHDARGEPGRETHPPGHEAHHDGSRSPARERGTLPKYMCRRGRMLYFKRKVPRDVLAGFAEQRAGQVWRSLGTDLVEPAKVLLAVEVTEFELRVAELRRQRALQSAARSAPGREGATTTGPELALPTGEGDTAHHGTNARAEQRAGAPVLLPNGQTMATRRAARSSQRAPAGLGLPAGADVCAACALISRPARGAQLPAAMSPGIAGINAVVRPTMLHLFEDWKRKQTRVRTINAVRTVVLEFRAMHGALPVEEITKAHARAYRDFLIERRLSRLTVENRIGFLATLVRHGMREMVEALAVNPFEGIDVSAAQGERAPKDRRAYSVAELNHLYASRLYTQGYRPKGQAVDAAYWLPLLGPFVGARIEELCQLRIEDVQRINGVWCIRICDLDETQRVKTASSFRRVPLHDAVVQAGFLAYVAQAARGGHERVFPTLSNDNAHGIYSNAVGKWYGRYLDSIGLTDRRLDYHSFRYLMRQQCSLCGIDNEVRDALTGHWLSNSDAGRTYMKAENRQYPFPKLVAAIRQLRYEELRLSHLFVTEPMAGVEEALLR
ncbi:MAG: site-specific integrase [Rubrivivax sp.]|nr:site-specific integrase [Rubrivivax sp.]